MPLGKDAILKAPSNRFLKNADIIANVRIEIRRLAVGIVMTFIGIGVAFWEYRRKDIS